MSGLDPKTFEAFNGEGLRARIFHDKYALRNENSEITEIVPQQMWERVARGLAKMESKEKRADWEKKFTWLLSDFRFVPGGRILHAIGNPNRVTSLNCYVIESPKDSVPGIYHTAAELAETFKRGGGCGVDISTLRPKGAPARNAAKHSTGAVSFMELYSLTTGIIGQQGRRGALMLTISDSHPDVLDFCRVKRNLTSARYANISVRVSEAFMHAVERDDEWLLRYENVEDRIEIKRTIRARDLWQEIITGAKDFAEPGCLFWDSIKRYSSSDPYPGMKVISTNPCGEQPLEPYGDCCLGSLNLAAFITNPFTPNAAIDFPSLEKAARYSVRFLDNVLTWNEGRHPLPSQEEAAKRGRRIGLGVMGLGDMLCQLRLKYDTDQAIEVADKTLEKIKLWAYDESANVAKEKGPFPVFEAKRHLENPYFDTFPPKLTEKIENQGLRNVTVLTIPPTGSVAAMAGITSGIEPIFALCYTRRSESLSEGTFEVKHPLVAKYKEMNPSKNDLPDFFVTAHEINPEKRVLMQAGCQKHIDQAISSTLNLPRDTSFHTVEKIYRLAWEQGLKGITVYREGSREGILLTDKESKQKDVAPTAITPRPVSLNGITTRERTPFGTAFITINHANGDPKDAFEMFIRLGKAGSDLEADAEGIGRLISLILRLPSPMNREHRLKHVIDQLEGIGGSRSLGFGTDKVRSIPDAIAKAIGRYLNGSANESENTEAPEKANPHASSPAPTTANTPITVEDFCPNCRQAALILERGCLKCAECGYKEC